MAIFIRGKRRLLGHLFGNSRGVRRFVENLFDYSKSKLSLMAEVQNVEACFES